MIISCVFDFRLFNDVPVQSGTQSFVGLLKRSFAPIYRACKMWHTSYSRSLFTVQRDGCIVAHFLVVVLSLIFSVALFFLSFRFVSFVQK